MAGLDFRHVVMSNVFLDRYENLEVADKVYNEFFEDGSRARVLDLVRQLDPRRLSRRDHLHRHDRPVRPQGRPPGRHQDRPD